MKDRCTLFDQVHSVVNAYVAHMILYYSYYSDVSTKLCNLSKSSVLKYIQYHSTATKAILYMYIHVLL